MLTTYILLGENGPLDSWFEIAVTVFGLLNGLLLLIRIFYKAPSKTRTN